MLFLKIFSFFFLVFANFAFKAQMASFFLCKKWKAYTIIFFFFLNVYNNFFFRKRSTEKSLKYLFNIIFIMNIIFLLLGILIKNIWMMGKFFLRDWANTLLTPIRLICAYLKLRRLFDVGTIGFHREMKFRAWLHCVYTHVLPF